VPNPKSISITFRFPTSLFHELKEEAVHKQISLNTLLNQIVTSHVEWHAHASKAGFMTVRRTLVEKLMDPLSEEEVDRMAKDMARELRDASLLMVRKHTEKSLLEFMERWVKTSGYSYRHIVEDNHHTYIIQHDMGYKWSYYLNRLFSYVAEEAAINKPEIKSSDKMLVVNLKVK
jgi:hypothetical protein